MLLAFYVWTSANMIGLLTKISFVQLTIKYTVNVIGSVVLEEEKMYMLAQNVDEAGLFILLYER